jgi:tetratricopeptide (TPR) repeat protein
MRLRVAHAITAITTCVAFVGVTLIPRGASAQQPPPPPAAVPPSDDANLAAAKQHFEAGKNAYNAGDYPTAIREFKLAEQLRSSPVLDYNIGLANEKLGKRRVAIKYYRRYLESMPNAQNRAEVEASVAELERQLAREAGGAPPPSSPSQPPPRATVPEQPGDMPPPSATTQPPSTTASYDPYGGQGQPQPIQATPPKKKSYWWVALIVVGGVALLTAVIVVAWLYAAPTTYYYQSGLVQERTPPTDTAQRGPSTFPLFSF